MEQYSQLIRCTIDHRNDTCMDLLSELDCSILFSRAQLLGLAMDGLAVLMKHQGHLDLAQE